MGDLRATRRRILEHATRGRLRPVLRPIHEGTVELLLGFERALDACAPRPTHAALSDLTAVIKTFERPRLLGRLLASIRRSYPTLDVVVVDDSRTPRDYEGARTVKLPYDSGVSAGRAAGLAAVCTPYVVQLDDDFVFFRRTHLGAALSILERHADVDLISGRVIDLPLYRVPPGATRELRGHVAGLPSYVFAPNFFVARTERVREVGFDPALKRLDHSDFFRRAEGVLTKVFDARLQVLHAPTPFDAAYMDKRLDIARDSALLQLKWQPESFRRR